MLRGVPVNTRDVDITPRFSMYWPPPVMVLSLERLIEVKRKLTRPKDQLMLLQLEALQEELRRRGR